MDIWNSLLEKSRSLIKKIEGSFKTNKKEFISVMLAGAILVSVVGYQVIGNKTKAFAIYMGDDIIGTVESEEEAFVILDELKKEISKECGADAVLEDDFNFEETHVKNEEVPSKDEVKSNIKEKLEFKVAAFVLKIEDEEVGVLKSGEEAESIIEEVKNMYIDEDADLQEVNILEDIDIVKKEVALEEIDEKESVLDYVKTGAEQIDTHIVEEGESYWTIAERYDRNAEELEEANPELKAEDLKPGDEVKLVEETSKITVITKEKVKYEDEIDFETETEIDDSMYDDESEVITEGKKGIVEKTVIETKQNGLNIEEEIIEEEIIEEPVTEVIKKGSKERPKTVATGSFSMPTRGRVSSGFGRRWGRMHRGIDIAAGYGTSINAADGGTVTFAGRNGSYGYMVEITHGNGFVTRYAHCSRLYVSRGQKVAKGQQIGAVGTSGRTTGPHLHFEIIRNGTHQNPGNYIR